MASPPMRDVDEAPLAAELARLRAVLRGARGVDRAALFAVVILVGVAIVLLKRLPSRDGVPTETSGDDPFLRILRKAPEDDEPADSAEEDQAARARTEPSISWEQAKRELAEPDS